MKKSKTKIISEILPKHVELLLKSLIYNGISILRKTTIDITLFTYEWIDAFIDNIRCEQKACVNKKMWRLSCEKIVPIRTKLDNIPWLSENLCFDWRWSYSIASKGIPKSINSISQLSFRKCKHIKRHNIRNYENKISIIRTV